MEVVSLSDSTFEHQTQAAAGQTTGHWCVLFTNSSLAEDPWQVAAEDAWHTLAEDADKSVIMAKVDVASSRAVAKRFGISSTPAVLLFRDRGMYSVSLAGMTSPDADKLAAAVTAFVEGGYEQQAAAAVPAEPGLLDVAKEAAKVVKVSPNIMFICGVICLSFGGVLFIAFMGVGIWYTLPPKPLPGSAAATDASAAAKKTDTPAETAAAAAAAAAGGAGAGAAGDAAAGGDDDGADEAEVVKPAARATRRRA
uniref:Thioredoxin domain-containing protein n=1 Tax=Tetradesmus obliquus TaxID=3088 RepID=A0A383W5L7_TETOB|eukprot:jgi/Sobl393_1/10846/SZX72935.1